MQLLFSRFKQYFADSEKKSFLVNIKLARDLRVLKSTIAKAVTKYLNSPSLDWAGLFHFGPTFCLSQSAASPSPPSFSLSFASEILTEPVAERFHKICKQKWSEDVYGRSIEVNSVNYKSKYPFNYVDFEYLITPFQLL